MRPRLLSFLGAGVLGAGGAQHSPLSSCAWTRTAFGEGKLAGSAHVVPSAHGEALQLDQYAAHPVALTEFHRR